MGEAFLQAIVQDESILSGSWLLQILLSPHEWQANDVDVFEVVPQLDDQQLAEAGTDHMRFSHLSNLLWDRVEKDERRFHFDGYDKRDFYSKRNSLDASTRIEIVRDYELTDVQCKRVQIVRLSDR